MFVNHSPWLHQLNRTRPVTSAEHAKEADVAIIGGGIAGVATAYFTLKNTAQTVMLVEANEIAHGATGHNGGFLASYFERSFSSIVDEFGMELAANAQRDMDSAWTLLDEIKEQVGLQTPLWQFTGYAACATKTELLRHLKDISLKAKAGLPTVTVMVSDHCEFISEIPQDYKPFYTILPKKDILDLLETRDESYIAILPERKGCMNSALFTEELTGYLLTTYADRFFLAEHAPVRRLVLKRDHAVLDISKNKQIAAHHVVLCTNGFENISIVNLVGAPVNKKFHYLVRGIVGYMAAYTEALDKPPGEISYLPKSLRQARDLFEEEPYFYLTRRPFETEEKETHNLICIGGPEVLMDDTNNYHTEHDYSEDAKRQIDNFLAYTYKHAPKDHIEYKFLWHGLMGFTPNGIRLIGSEPSNPILLYNLGCNGVGLLPSIFGGLKISKHLSNEAIAPSIFDPRNIHFQKPRKAVLRRAATTQTLSSST